MATSLKKPFPFQREITGGGGGGRGALAIFRGIFAPLLLNFLNPPLVGIVDDISFYHQKIPSYRKTQSLTSVITQNKKGYRMVFASMRAVCLFLRARALVKLFLKGCEQLQNFCEHDQVSTRVIFASNSSKGQILRAL